MHQLRLLLSKIFWAAWVATVANVKTSVDTVISFEWYPRIKFVYWSSDHEYASKYVDQKDEVWRGHPGTPLVDAAQKSTSLE